MDISELLKQRKLTRAVAAVLTGTVETHLKTLTPLLNPRRVFGEQIHGGPRAATPSGARALGELRELYAQIHSNRPFDLRRDVDTPLMLLDARPELQALSYQHVAQAGDEQKSVLVNTPLQWILSYRGFGPSRLRELLGGNAAQGGPSIQETVLHTLMLVVTLRAQPDLMALFEALRFPLRIETLEEFGQLPIPVLGSPLTTGRPDDQVIIDSTEVSGSNDFEEIIDPGVLNGPLPDPLRDRIDAAIRPASQPDE